MAIKKLTIDGYTREYDQLVSLWKVLGSFYLPDTIRAIGQQATKGNLKAVQTLFVFLGWHMKKF